MTDLDKPEIRKFIKSLDIDRRAKRDALNMIGLISRQDITYEQLEDLLKRISDSWSEYPDKDPDCPLPF